MNKQKTLDFIGDFGASAATILRLLLSPVLPHRRHCVRKEDSIVILGNGPSLNDTLANHAAYLGHTPLMAVNFAANTPMFTSMKPAFYVLADPHFFVASDSDPNVSALWRHLGEADWGMTLFVPYGRESMAGRLTGGRITVRGFTMTPAEGFRCLRHAVYSAGSGTPRPRNVLIPALMIALRLGFGTIYVAGADHTWTRTLSVDDSNRVVSIQPHFYEDDEHEQKRQRVEYHNYPLHSILQSLYTAFRAYFLIQQYAESIGARIFNVTPGSFIDAFPRATLPRQ